MTIRQCVPDDFPMAAKLLREFHEESMREYGLKIDEDIMNRVMRENYKHALVMVVDNEVVGVIAGKVVEYPLQKDKIFQEMVWYVSKDYRRHGMKLLKALEQKCKEQGIRMLIMVAMGNSMKEKLDKIYKMMGYAELETHYIKVIE